MELGELVVMKMVNVLASLITMVPSVKHVLLVTNLSGKMVKKIANLSNNVLLLFLLRSRTRIRSAKLE